MKTQKSCTWLFHSLLASMMLTVPTSQAWAVPWDVNASTPSVQAKVEGSVPTDEQISTSTATASSTSAAGSGSAVLNAALGSMHIQNQTNFDWDSVGARTVVDYDYFTIHGITGQVTIDPLFGTLWHGETSSQTSRKCLERLALSRFRHPIHEISGLICPARFRASASAI